MSNIFEIISDAGPLQPGDIWVENTEGFHDTEDMWPSFDPDGGESLANAVEWAGEDIRKHGRLMNQYAIERLCFSDARHHYPGLYTLAQTELPGLIDSHVAAAERMPEEAPGNRIPIEYILGNVIALPGPEQRLVDLDETRKV